MTALNPLMRIGDQVAETVRLHVRYPRRRRARMARETLELVGLPRRGTARVCPTKCPAASGSASQSPWPWCSTAAADRG